MQSERSRQSNEKVSPLPNDAPFRPLDFSALSGASRPIEWMIEGYIPRGQCILFSGPTKVGKSYVMQHMMTCLALGLPWFDIPTSRAKVFGLFCEENREPLHWRRDQILRFLDADAADFEPGGFMGYPRRGQVNHLVRFDRRTDQGEMTPLWDKLKFAVTEKYGSQFIFLDTARQVFDGDENRALQVTVFVNELNRFAEQIDGCIVIATQPSKGIESVFAGSGAWANTARSHLNLTPPEGLGWRSPERVFRNLGSNYSGPVPDLRLRWSREVMMFVLDDTQPEDEKEQYSAPSGMIERLEFDGRVLAAAQSFVVDNAWIVAAAGDRRSLALRLSRTVGFSKTSQGALQAATDRLIAEGKLVRVTIGSGASAAVLLRPGEMRYANEAAR